ncbi:MAG TPA: hypothetical protein VGM33_07240, partial [Baekduia sp.]
GDHLRVVQTATNDDGSSDTTSPLTPAVVAGAPPVNVTPPDAGTTPTHGTVLHGAGGTWTGASSTAVRWQSCTTTSTSSCTDIAGATTLDYTPTAGDVGHYLRVVETATNGNGSTPAASSVIGPVAAVPPANDTAPVAGTAATRGTALHGQAGTWTDENSTAVRWQSCTSSTDPSSCTDIPGATTLDYTPTADDVGTYLRIVETATNGDGDTEQASAVTDAVAGLPPVDDTPPSISTSGAAQEGHAVTGDRGSWTDAVSYAAQYQRCTSSTDPSTCTDIPGATALDYTPTADDAGRYLRLIVTATNPWGSTAADSALGDQVLPAPPAVVVAPGTGAATDPGTGTTIAALDQQPAGVGTALHPDLGDFRGATGVTYQYQRCATEDESSCVDIPGATDPTYVPGNEDVGFHVRLVVQATNAGGTVTVATPMTRAVAARPVTPPPAAPVATPAAAAAPAAGPAPVAVRKACISRRSVTLHWIVPKGRRVTSFTVNINGKRYANLPGRRTGVNVRMNGRPAQVVTVVVTARTRSGRKFGTTRRYQTCGGKLAGLPLATIRLGTRG